MAGRGLSTLGLRLGDGGVVEHRPPRSDERRRLPPSSGPCRARLCLDRITRKPLDPYDGDSNPPLTAARRPWLPPPSAKRNPAVANPPPDPSDGPALTALGAVGVGLLAVRHQLHGEAEGGAGLPGLPPSRAGMHPHSPNPSRGEEDRVGLPGSAPTTAGMGGSHRPPPALRVPPPLPPPPPSTAVRGPPPYD